MLASDMVRTALAGAGKTQKELAEYMGWTPQNLSARLKNNSLTFDELAKALNFTGCKVSMKTANGAELSTSDANSIARVLSRWSAAQCMTQQGRHQSVPIRALCWKSFTLSFSAIQRALTSWSSMSSGRMDTIESLQLPMRWLRNSGLCAQLLGNLSAIKYIVDSTKIFVKYPVLT